MSVSWAAANCGVASSRATAARVPLKRLVMRTEQKKAGFRRITSAFAARNRAQFRRCRRRHRSRASAPMRRGDRRREKSILPRRRPGNAPTRARARARDRAPPRSSLRERACARSPPVPRQYAPAASSGCVMTIVEAAGRSAFSMSDTSLSRSAPNTIGSGSGNSRFR